MPEEPLENRHELESGVENEKEISKKKTKPRKQNTKPNYIDQDEDLSKEVPRATKKKRREAELSDFEKNVIMKNIEERKKMERELGLYNLSEDIRNILQVLSRSVRTILWEMMSKLKEKYTCMLLYDCILQK